MAVPFAVAKKIPRDTQDVRRCPKIAAIDFGTTFCSLAYTLSEDDEIANVGLDEVLDRVPTAILLKKTSPSKNATLTVAEFGRLAQNEISKLTWEVPEYLYFECFKMMLRRKVSYRI